ncbi:MAG: DUF1351 domain-containing protein [Sarcina sp.]|nr:DUF1351 domain-containing protein [Sarcina sp.]
MALELKIVSPSEEGFVKEIVWNADEIATEVEAKIGYYKNLVYTEDQVTEAKKDRAQLNKFISALKDKDREIKRLCLAPYEAFHNKMLKIISLVEEPVAMIDTQVKGFEEQQKKQKMQAIQEMFDSKGFWPWLTLEKLMGRHESTCKKWMNKSCSMKQIESDMIEIQHRMGEDILALNGLKFGAQMALSEYKRSMDVTAAMAEAQKFEEARQAEEALKRQLAEQAQAQPAGPSPALEDERPFGSEPGVQMQMDLNPEPAAPIPVERREKAFKVFVTKEELDALNRFLIDNGYIFKQISL